MSKNNFINKDILRKLKEVDKVSKKAKRAKKNYIKSLSKGLEIGLLILTEVELSNDKHINELPTIISRLDECIADAQELIKDFRVYIQ